MLYRNEEWWTRLAWLLPMLFSPSNPRHPPPSTRASTHTEKAAQLQTPEVFMHLHAFKT